MNDKDKELLEAALNDLKEMERLAWLCNICNNKDGCQNPNGCIDDFRWRGSSRLKDEHVK